MCLSLGTHLRDASAEEMASKLTEYSSSPGKASARSTGMVRTPAGYAMSMDSSSQLHAMPGQQAPCKANIPVKCSHNGLQAPMRKEIQ